MGQNTRVQEEAQIPHTPSDAQQTEQPVREELVFECPAMGENLIIDLCIVGVLLVEVENGIEVFPLSHSDSMQNEACSLAKKE
jgi:hypothetical protein